MLRSCRTLRGPLGLLVCLLFCVLAPVDAGAQGLDLIVLEGDAVPGTTSSVFDSFTPPVVNDDGEIAFRGSYDSGGGLGIFLYSDGTLVDVARTGQMAPETGGGMFAGFLPPAINASGQVAFVATFVGGTVGAQGLYLYSGGSLTKLALLTESPSDAGGGTIAGFQAPLGLTDSGEAIVTTSFSGGPFGIALYGFSSTASRRIVANGDPAPAPLAGTYFNIGTPGVSGAGEIALSAFLLAPTFVSALVRIDPAGDDELVALAGDLAPGTDGGTIGVISLTGPAVNDAGQVAFQSSVMGGSSANGLFVFDGVEGAPAALPGQTAPGTGGSETYGQPVVNPTIDGAGRVGFRIDFFGAAAGEGLFVDAGGPDWPVAISGQDAPGVTDSTFDVFPNPPALSPGGEIAFDATTTGASTLGGIWTLPAPEPGFGSGLALGAGLLAALRSSKPRGGVACDSSRRRRLLS